MKKDKKPDSLAVIDNHNFYERQTDIHTDMATIWLTRPREQSRWKILQVNGKVLYTYLKISIKMPSKITQVALINNKKKANINRWPPGAQHS